MASLNVPHNVFALPDGGFLIADTGNNRIRRVAANGIIQTIAGNGKRGFSGDGGNALKAELAVPKAVSVTPAGDILVADEGNDRIRFIGVPVAPRRLSAPTVSGTRREGPGAHRRPRKVEGNRARSSATSGSAALGPGGASPSAARRRSATQ